MKEVILDLCGGTGSWAKPYKDAGYEVITLTLPSYDVCKWWSDEDFLYFEGSPDMVVKKSSVYGVLAAPPCTMFSHARTNAKKPRDLKEGMECVRACLDIIWHLMEIKGVPSFAKLPLKFWALENPYHGFLLQFLGKPAFTFDPWEFGDGYQKRTALWGNFKEPLKSPVEMTEEMKKLAKTNSYLHKIKYPTAGRNDEIIKSAKDENFRKFDRQTRRSITPQGFANAFYKANP